MLSRQPGVMGLDRSSVPCDFRRPRRQLEAPVHPNVTRNGGVGPRHRSLSTSPSRTTLAASNPGVDHPPIPVFLARNRQDDAVRLKTGSIGRARVGDRRRDKMDNYTKGILTVIAAALIM